MNYEDMSDHEINMAVTCIDNNCQGWSVLGDNSGFYHCGIDGSGFYEVECVDYCNSPSDAWPIIDLIWDELMKPPYRGFGTTWERLMDEFKCGKLRAAMICFLKVKDAENEK